MASSPDHSTQAATASPPLQHPTPSLVATESLRRSFSSSHASLAPSLVERLDRSAEEMSAGGSDIADEIRKMSQEQKTTSRPNSVHSSQHGDNAPGRASDVRRSRTSSQNTSILDSARWGGYSPTGSIHSRTSQKRNSRPRQASAAGASRLAQVMVEPTQEGRPLDSPLAPSNPEFSVPSRHASQSSFALRYDQIASQIEESLQHVPPSPEKPTQVTDALLQLEGSHNVTAPARPRSTDTYQEAQHAFKDFDGVHYNQQTDELIEVDEHGNEVRRVSARSSNGGFSLEAASMLRQPLDNHMSHYGAPPPTEGMVYYPAPVPRMLNLPKRLSHMPPPSTVAKRRTQILSQYGPDIRASAPWLAESRGDNSDVRSQLSGSASQVDSQPRGMINERMSVANFNNVPPQLRASVFFDHQTIVQDVKVEHESAVDTLDSILAASATAPVNAFLDHPYAGNVMKSVFAPEKAAARRSTATLATAASGDSKKRELNKKRSSSIGRLFRRSSSNELAETLKQNGSRSSILVDPNNKTARRKSRVSFGDDLTQASRPGTPADGLSSHRLSGGLIDQALNASPHDDTRTGSRPATAMSHGHELTEAEQIEQDFRDQDEQDPTNEEDEDNTEFVQPATLLAELQVRKAQQKSRNKTAATAFPNGMHSTLLELDAVEEINRRKRRQQRPTLAWEDPALRVHDGDEANEDVPLGMLFPGKDGATTRKTGDLRDWDRPLGLMEKRRLEDNEPLSSRRNRLRGISPNKARAIAMANRKAMQAQLEAEEPEDEHAGETLGQRSRRLKTKSALDSAISDVAPTDGERPVSTFTDDIMSQFGGLDVKEKEKPVDIENETLGQRKARLQREAGGEKAKPRLKSSNSLGDLLAQNPAGLRSTSREHHLAEGTLLHSDQLARTKAKQDLLSTNMRASLFNTGKPLVEARPTNTRQPSGNGLLGQQGNSAAAKGGFAGGTYNNGSGGLGGMQQQPQASPQMYSMANGAYFPSPTAATMYNPYANMMMPQQQQQPQRGNMMRNSSAYQALNGGHMSTFGMPGMYPQQFGGMQQTQQYGMMPNMHMNMNNMGMMMPGNTATDMSQMAYDPNIDPKQRDMIDRWRMAVP